MNSIKNNIKLLDTGQRLKVDYTCMTDAVDLKFVLDDYQLASSDEALLFIKTPDGAIKSVAGTKDFTDNSLTFNIPAGFFPVSGESKGQIRITKEAKRLYSNPIRLNIHPYYGGR